MQFFDSLTHITADGSWMGERRYDASLEALQRDMAEGGVGRALLVTIADHGDNDVTLAAREPIRTASCPSPGSTPGRCRRCGASRRRWPNWLSKASLASSCTHA